MVKTTETDTDLHVYSNNTCYTTYIHRHCHRHRRRHRQAYKQTDIMEQCMTLVH